MAEKILTAMRGEQYSARARQAKPSALRWWAQSRARREWRRSVAAVIATTEARRLLAMVGLSDKENAYPGQLSCGQ